MMEIQTYCERCGNTYSARYDQYRLCLVLWCEPCDYSELTIAAKDLLALPEGERERLRKLAERTAERNGEPLPAMLSATVMEPAIAPLDFTPLLESVKPIADVLQEILTEMGRALGLPPAESGKSPLPPQGFLFGLPPLEMPRPALPPIEVPPLAAPPVTIQRLPMDVKPEGIDRMKMAINLARRCRQSKDVI